MKTDKKFVLAFRVLKRAQAKYDRAYAWACAVANGSAAFYDKNADSDLDIAARQLAAAKVITARALA